MRFNTGLLHGKTSKPYSEREILPPISQVSAYRYESMEELEKVFAHRAFGYAYTRIGNPTVTALEQRINELEGGSGAICTSSGMAAISSALLAICESGDEIIASTGLYGGTIDLFHDLKKLGIKTVFADELTAESVRALATDHTRAVVGEMISNPSLKVMDIPEVSEATHELGIPLIVDSTTATPLLAKPLSLGADIVIHSTSKYLNGGGNSIGGAIVDGGHFPWDFAKFSALSEFKKYGKAAFMIRLRTDLWENLGGCMAPMNAYLSYIGIDTLGLRMDRICKNAAALAESLSRHPDIEVNYLTLPDHPYHKYVEQLLSGYGGGILSFRAGSKKRAFEIIDALKVPMIASNIGDVRTLVIHPASTLYIRSNEEERIAAGVYEDTVRVSVGIEDADDLIEDFNSAIEHTGKE